MLPELSLSGFLPNHPAANHEAWLRDALAGAQATYLGLLGAVLGVLVGIAPGIAISRILTSTYTETGLDHSSVIIAIPWLQILLPVLLVPLVAGALAWVSVRRAPVVTRRAT